MYHIKKHQDRWTIHNGDNGGSRALTWLEMLIVMIEFPELGCQQVSTVYAGEIESIKENPDTLGATAKKAYDLPGHVMLSCITW